MNNWSPLNPLPKIMFLVFFLMIGYANDSFAQQKKHDAISIDQNKPIIAEDGSTFTPVLQPKVKLRKNIFERLQEKLQETFSKKEESLEGEKEEEEMRTDRPDLAAEQEFRITKDPRMGYVPTERLKVVRERIKELQALKIQNGSLPTLPSGVTTNWSERGPSNVGGRTRAIMFDPNDATKKKVWAGGAGGGLWYTNDITATTPVWNNVSDVWANMAISSIVYNPANTQELYVGTGEGWNNSDAIRGAGIWKSSNGGSTWTQLSSIATDNNFDYVQKIVVTSGGVVFAATRSRFCNRGGVYKSTNGGTSWTLSLGTQGTSCGTSNSSAADLEIGSDGTIFATLGIFNLGGIYKSSDVGATWTQLNTGTNGFPTTGFYRIEMCVAPSDPNRLYAMAHSSSTNALLNIYTSANKGSTWTTCTLPSWVDQSCNAPSSDMTRTQAWYDLIIAVDPNNPTTLMVGGIDVMKSTDSGTTWTQISSWAGACSRQYMHADQHAIVYQPGSSTIALFGNDGGVYYTANANATIPTIAGKNTGYNVTQFYSCAIHPTAGQDYYLAGAQDNGSQKFSTSGINSTSEVSGGDGAYCFIDQTNPSYQISSYVYNNFYLTTNNWSTYTSISSSSTGSFINPADYDDTNHILYSSYSTTQIQRITGITGTRVTAQFTVTGMAAKAGHLRVSPYAPSGTSTLYVGTQDSKLFKVTNAQGTPTITNISGASFPAGATISCVEIGASENDLLVTFSNYGVVSVWRTTDGGTTWANVEGNLPDMPVRWALYNPINRSQVLLATEMGVWTTTDITVASPSWVADNAIANVRVDMLQIRSSDKQVAAATHGRGLFTASIACESPVITSPPAMPAATCSGTGTQILSVVATGTSLTYSWRRNGVALTDGGVISGSTTATLTLTNPTTANEGSYDVVVTNFGCATVTPTAVTVTVNAIPTATAGTALTTCQSSSPTPITLSGASVGGSATAGAWSITTGGGTLSSTAQTASPGSVTYTPAANASETVTLTLTSNAGAGCTVATSTRSININPTPSITIAATTASVYLSASSQTTTLSYSATSGSPTTYSITWNATPSNSFAAVANAALSATPINISVPANTPAGTYTGVLTVKNGSGCTSGSSTFTVTVDALQSIATGTIETPICAGSSINAPFTITGTFISGNVFTAQLSDAAGSFSNPTSIGTLTATASGTIVATIPSNQASGTGYRIRVVSTSPVVTGTQNSAALTINALPTANAGGPDLVCQAATPTALTLSGASVGGSAISGAWSIISGGGTLSNTTQTTTPATVTYTPVANATGNVLLQLTTNTGSGCTVVTATRTITLDLLPTITTAASTTEVCQNSNSQSTALTYSATTGSPVSYSITWVATPTNSFASVSNAVLSANAISIAVPANANAGTYTGMITVKNANGCTSAAKTFTVTVNPTPSITPLASETSVYFNANTQTAPLAYSATSGTPTSYSIVWNPTPSNSFVAVNNSSLPASPIGISVPGGTAPGTYTGSISVANAGGCISASTGFTVTVIPTPTITTGSVNNLICIGATINVPYTITSTFATGNIFTAQLSDANGSFANPTSIGTLNSLVAGTIQAVIPSGVSAGSAYQIRVVSSAPGVIGTPNSGTISINSQPTAFAGNPVSVCRSASPSAITLNGATIGGIATTGTWSIVSGGGTLGSTLPTNAPANVTYTPAANFNGTVTLLLTTDVSTGCSAATSTLVITVNDLPSATAGSDINVCQSATPIPITLNGAIVGGSATTGAWSITTGGGTLSSTAQTASPGSVTYTPAANVSETVTLTLTSNAGAGCTVATSTRSININPTPSITLDATTTSVFLNASSQTTTLNYSAISGSPTTYSITWNATPSNSFAAVSNAVLAASPINISVPANTPAGTYTGILTVKNASGCTSVSSTFTVTVDAVPSIATGTIGTPICAGSSINVPFTITGTFINGNSFIAQLSDATGAFTNPTNIGTLTSTTAGTISATIPSIQGSGTAYRIRVISTTPAVNGTQNGAAITINALPTANAGGPNIVCQAATPTALILSGASVGGSATTAAWSIFSGAGTLSSIAQTLSPATVTYTPAANATGIITLRLTSNAGTGCTAAIATRTITLDPLPTITTAASATAVCQSSSSQSTVLSYSATTGSPLTYSITWNTTPANSFVAVSNATLSANSVSIAIPANAAAGTYTGNITVRNTNGCASISKTFTITVNAIPTITNATTATTVCFSANAQTTPLTYSATTGTPTTYSLVWNATPSNTFAAVSDATLTTGSIGILVPAGTAAGVYTGTLTVRNATGCVSANKTFTATVNALPTITASATATSVCQSTAAQTTSLSYSATSGTPTTYSIAWSNTPTNAFVAVNNVTLPAGSISIAVPANTAAGTYTGTLTVRNASGCISTVRSFTITVNPLPTISTAATASGVCLSTASQLTTLSYSATTASPLTYSLTWNTTPANSFAAASNATLPANAINITVAANAAAGTYTGNLTVRNANLCVSTTKTFTLAVNAVPTITNAATATAVCFNANAQTTPLTYSATTGTPTTYSIVWNATPSNAFTAVSNATLTSGSIGIAVPAGTAAGVYTGTLTVRNATGCVSANKIFTVTVNALPTITAAATATSVCQSTAAQTAPLSYSATSGTSTTYSIAWSNTPTNAFVAVNNVTLPAGSISIAVPANTAAGTYTGTLTVRNANGCISVGTPFTITVNPLPMISSAATASGVCLSTASQLTTLSYSATTASPLTYSLTWNTTPANTFAAASNATLPANAINITVPANAAAGTYTGNLTVRNANLCVSTAKTFTLAVNALPTITTATTATAVCSSASAQTTTLTYSAATGTPITYSLTWNATPTNTFKAIVDTALTTSPIVLKVPANTAPGTYTGTIKVKNANGCESTVRTFTITVNALISITAAATATDVTASTASQTTPLTYSATTGTPTTYSITWNPTPVNSFAAVTNTALPASPIRVTVPANTPAGTFTGNLTVRNAGGCVSAPRIFTVTVTGIAAIAANNSAEISNATGLSLNNGILPADPNKAELLPNVPNPFHDFTQIGFYLPKSTEGYLTIRDEKGAVVYRQKASYYQGWNQVTIKQSDLKAVGVLYYTLETPDFIGTKKMVLLNR